jgi:hypothetical protein
MSLPGEVFVMIQKFRPSKAILEGEGPTLLERVTTGPGARLHNIRIS